MSFYSKESDVIVITKNVEKRQFIHVKRVMHKGNTGIDVRTRYWSQREQTMLWGPGLLVPAGCAANVAQAILQAATMAFSDKPQEIDGGGVVCQEAVK